MYKTFGDADAKGIGLFITNQLEAMNGKLK
jgi:hypothetical protein